MCGGEGGGGEGGGEGVTIGVAAGLAAAAMVADMAAAARAASMGEGLVAAGYWIVCVVISPLAAPHSRCLAAVPSGAAGMWPAVIAVMREVNPRDTTAEVEFLKISVDAFDPQHAGSDPVEYLVKPVLKEMQTRYARYLASVGASSRRGSRWPRRRRWTRC